MLNETQKAKLVERAEARLDEFGAAIETLKKCEQKIDFARSDVLGEYSFRFQCDDENCREVFAELETARESIFTAIEAIRQLMKNEERKIARVDEW